MQRTVLIETSWNVKPGSLPEHLAERERINRNIVECKERRSHRRNGQVCGINRNIVECKDKDAW